MPRLFPNQVWVETERPVFPQKCVCCGAVATTFYRPTPPSRPKGLPSPECPLELPYCEPCRKNLVTSQWHGTWKLVALNIVIWGVAALLMAKLPLWVAFVPVFLGGIVLFWATTTAKHETSQVEGAVSNDVVVRCLWHRKATYVFSFAREAYAEEFRKLNALSLTPQSELK